MLSSIFKSRFRNVLFEVLRQLDYDDLIELIQINTKINSFAKTNVLVQKLIFQENFRKLIINHGSEENVFFHCCRSGLLKTLDHILLRGNVNPMCQYARSISIVCSMSPPNTLKIVDRLLQDPRFDALASSTKIWSDLDDIDNRLIDYNFDYIGLMYLSRLDTINVELLLKFLDDSRITSHQINPFNDSTFMENLYEINDPTLLSRVF